LPELHYTLGVILLQQAKPDEAAAAFQKPRGIKSDYGEAVYTLGSVRLNELKTNRQAATFSMNTGIANLKAGKIDESSAQFENVIKLPPDNADGYYNLSRALKAKGKKAEADAAYRKAKQLNQKIKPL